MEKITRREVIKLGLLSCVFPREVLSSIDKTKEDTVRIISFNTQRDFNLSKLKQDLFTLIKSLEQTKGVFVLGLQEVCKEIFIYLEEITKEKGLKIERGGTRNENVNIFPKDIDIINSSNLEIEQREALKIDTIIGGEKVTIINGDFDSGISKKTRDLRYNQLIGLLSKIKNIEKSIITVDTNFLLYREKRKLIKELKHIKGECTKLDYTYNPSRLEEASIEHILGKLILEYLPILNIELDKIITKGFKIEEERILSNITVSDHYPIYAKIK